LGIGAVTAVFSVLHGVLLAPLPFPAGESLVRLYATSVEGGIVRGPMSPPDMWDVREGAGSVAAVSPVFSYEGTLEDADGNAVRIPAYVVSADFFEVFRVPMAAGRGFLFEEDAPGSPIEVVLSHALWQTALGGDPAIVGQTITVEAGPVTVVGVAPPEMRYPRDAAMWILPGFNWPNMARRGRGWDVVARLEPGRTVAAAQTELSLIARRLEEEHPEWNRGVGITVVPLKESIVGDLRVALVILMAASAGLLLVASANVANLMVARGAARLQETALRAALGASRLRLIGTLFAEASVTAVGGAVLGLLIAVLSLAAFRRMAPPEVSLLGEVVFGWQGLVFAGIVTVGTTVLFGLLPAVRASATDLRTLLGTGGRRATSGAGGSALRSSLVVLEVAVATSLVIGSGLLIRSYRNVSISDPGFATRQALTFTLAPQIGLYGDFGDVSGFYERLMHEMDALPGVTGATFAATLPLGPELDPMRPIRILDLPSPTTPKTSRRA
jgi:predicted permease